MMRGFWSYVHNDDENEGGRIVELAHDVVAEFEMRTADSIELFLDRDSLEWGDDWREKIDEGLATAAFFVAVLTPRYFQSSECRRELQHAAKRATELGIAGLVLPLLYLDVPALEDPTSDDELSTVTRRLQWRDWREVRFAEKESEQYRREVADLVTHLIEANSEAERTDIAAAAAKANDDSTRDDDPGWLERMALSETTLPELGETLTSVAGHVETVNRVVTEGTRKIQEADRRGQGLAARLGISKALAHQLHGPADEIYALGSKLAGQMRDVDDGLRLLIERLAEEAREDSKDRDKVCTLFTQIRGFCDAASESYASTQGMIDAMAPLESASRDLRKPVRRMREGLTSILEGSAITESWRRAMDDAGLDCDGPPESDDTEPQ